MAGVPAETRPSPDALLKAAEKEKRGKLKIFLGAAPGVGKTYEMLSAARRRKAQGVDVVVGVVETHGRAETEAQAAGLEIVPRRRGRLQGPHPRRDGSRRHPGATAGAGAGRRARPHQCAGQPPSQALPRCRGAADGRHRRLLDDQRAAHREPERRGGAHHPRARARDGARPHRRRRRRGRAGRSARRTT